MKRLLKDWKIWLGIAVSGIFLWLAFRKVVWSDLWFNLGRVDYRLVIMAMLVPFASHWLRACRWRFLLAPIRAVRHWPLFSALMIGYSANTFLPAHLGELVRTSVLARKKEIPWPQVFTTVVVERLLDMLLLVILMALTLLIFPFPHSVKMSGVMLLAFTFLLSSFLVLAKRRRVQTLKLLARLLRPLSERWRSRLLRTFDSFLDGLVPLQRAWHYGMVLLLSILIWAGYVLSFFILLYAFHFDRFIKPVQLVTRLATNVSLAVPPNVDLFSTLVLFLKIALIIQIITTISVVVPSTPGYVGTFHALCIFSLGLLQIKGEPVPGYAIVMHALTFLPVLLVGLTFLFTSGLKMRTLREDSRQRPAV